MRSTFRMVGIGVVLGAFAAVSHAAAFQNGGFEFNNVPAGDYKYAPGVSAPGHENVAATGWTFVGGTGVSHNSSAWTSFTAPEGTSYAFIQGGSGSVLTQTFDVANGQTYRVTFKSLTRVYQNSSGTYTYGIGATVYGNSPVDTSGWRDNSFDFTATGASATLTFTGDSTGDNSAFLDQITLTPVPEPFTMGLGAAAIAVALRRRKK
ncbi:MAG: DUF642 domain-containing protein [Fimbriimonadaceae bacterium]|nr:DUF642 domain-containing protein [Chthonomonadaceae bacterium]MCO5297257.1 DUF642 domain-containing protein [Fimbriimonadaceae bacterium]